MLPPATPAANTGTGASTIIVDLMDHTPPVISGVPADITAEATEVLSGAAVTYSLFTARQIPTTPSPVDLQPGLGQRTFAIGQTTVTCNATDAHGQQRQQETFNGDHGLIDAADLS